MALVVVCGQPCSGKSTAAACLVKALADVRFSIKLIDEPTLNLDRNISYSSMPMEKNLRGLLRSEVDRSVSKESLVIVDSLNNIKGYRYELWCIARAAGIRYCLLYCDTEDSTCRTWNNFRSEQGLPSYDSPIFEDLIGRFEEPEKKNRWDSPLLYLKLREGDISEATPGIVEAATFLKDANEQATRKSSLQPTVATQNVYSLPFSDSLLLWFLLSNGSSRISVQAHASDTNSLYELDRATQEIINVLMEAQAQGLVGVLGTVDLGGGLPLITMHRAMGLPELRRHRRTFIKLTGQTCLSGPPPPSDTVSAKRMFADYLNRELSSSQ